MTVEEILNAERCRLDCDAKSKKRALEAVSELLAGADATISGRVVFDALFARERLGSTALGSGVALPHGRIQGLQSAVGAFVRLTNPIDFDAPDGAPVDLVFGLIVPEECTDTHLEILAGLAARFSVEVVRGQLRTETVPARVCELLGRAPLAV